MAAKTKKTAAKAKAKPAAKPAAKVASKPAARKGNKDLVGCIVAYAQANPAVAVVGIIVLLVAFVLFIK
ncbi:MAG TPA: hypothetical protein VHP58_01000 [Alphaproteobacteria bacterium]|nr:hypothetical protein [Alphaproteobacteria bacterium]